MSDFAMIALAEIIDSIEDDDERARVGEAMGTVCADYTYRFDWSMWRRACRI
jgi:hypothetical protein